MFLPSQMKTNRIENERTLINSSGRLEFSEWYLETSSTQIKIYFLALMWVHKVF